MMHTSIMSFTTYLLTLILLVRTCSAIVINEIQTRRATLSSFATTTTALTFLGPAEEANAAVVDQEERIVVPGTGMKPPLKNIIINENDDSSITDTQQKNVITQLGKSRICAKELSPLNPSLVPFAADNELFYDPFMFGSWDATTTLKRKIYPYGTQYLPSNSLYEGSPRNRMEKPGDSTSYELHYFSSSSNDNENVNKIDLNQSTSKLKVIADRVYNTKSMNMAYKQLSQIEDILWDYKKDPTRLTLQFGTLGEDMQPLGERRGEIYINGRKTEMGRDESTNEPVFCSSERVRSVLLIPGDVVVSDTETITEYRVINGSDGDHLKGTSRIAVYLTPNPNSREGLLWQSVGGKAVAFFDYEIDLKRKCKDSKPFVITPKGTSQIGI